MFYRIWFEKDIKYLEIKSRFRTRDLQKKAYVFTKVFIYMYHQSLTSDLTLSLHLRKD